jgi:hypothetical protein
VRVASPGQKRISTEGAVAAFVEGKVSVNADNVAIRNLILLTIV